MEIVLTIATIFFAEYAYATSPVSRTCPTHMRQLRDNICKLMIPYKMETFVTSNALAPGVLAAADQEFFANQISLGQKLFYDHRLSSHQKFSCATCHDPRFAFTDGRKTARGANDEDLSRNTPALWNLVYRSQFFWDGRAKDLHDQLNQVVSNPKEMASSPALIVKRLSEDSDYLKMFRDVFGTSTIDWGRVSTAIIAFEKSLVSFNSRYDQYALGNHAALDVIELKGFNVFRSFLARCSECHTPPLFTNQQHAVLGFSKIDNASGSFHVPSLRNVALTAPYMHDGRFKNLAEVIAFYNKGGGRYDADATGQLVHWHIRPIGLAADEMLALERFLSTLTDTSVLPALN